LGRRTGGSVFGVWMVFVLFVAVSGVMFNVPLAKSSKTWTVDDDGPADFSSIQQAINSQSVAAGDTIFVYSGTYYENVVINKTVSLIGENKDTTTIDGGFLEWPRTVVKIIANNTVFRGFTTKVSGFMAQNILLNNTANTVIADNNIVGGEDGVALYNSTQVFIVENNVTKSGVEICNSFNNTVSGNNLTEVRRVAIDLSESFNNTIVGNSVTGWVNPLYGYMSVGIRMMALPGQNSSSHNTFYNNHIRNCRTAICAFHAGVGADPHHNNVFLRNTIEDNGGGLYMDYSVNFTFKDNTFSRNVYNIGVYGSSLSEYIHDMDTSNTVNGKPVYYLINQKNLKMNPIAFPDIGYLALINSTNITVENLNLKENDQGLLMACTQNSTILDNNITNNTIGIRMDILTSNNTISRNNIVGQTLVVGQTWAGILSQYSFNNSITRNTVSDNEIGIYLKTSFNNTLTFNSIENNSRGGVWLDYSFNNVLVSNKISNNSAEAISDAGVSLYLSYANKIFHNNFINNQRQAYTCLGNFWDDGYPSGGNYWSDYTGVDEKNGPNQDQPGSDGIGDTPYAIDAQDRDGYPLMNPWILPDITPPATTISLSGVLGRNDWYKSDVLVTLSAIDDTEVDKTEYSFDNTTWITYSTPFTITNDGSIIIYYKSTDKAGNPEAIKTKTIKIDKTIPSGTIMINNDAAYATSTSVTLSLTAADATSDVYGVRYSNYGAWDTEKWEDFSSTKTWTLMSGDGTKTVYYQIEDNAELISTTYSDTIILDTTPPIGSIKINDGAAYTTTTTVTLILSATDATSGLAEMRLSNDNTTYTEWQTYTTSKPWTLQDGDGTKTVYVQYRDKAGLISLSYEDTISSDTTKPTANAGQDITVYVDKVVTFDASGSTDNVGIVSYEWNFGDGTTGTGKTTTHTYANPGPYTVTLIVKDAAGNSATHALTVTVLSPPSVEAFPIWIIGAIITIIGIAVGATLLLRRRK